MVELPQITCTHGPQFGNTGLRSEAISEHEIGLGGDWGWRVELEEPCVDTFLTITRERMCRAYLYSLYRVGQSTRYKFTAGLCHFHTPQKCQP